MEWARKVNDNPEIKVTNVKIEILDYSADGRPGKFKVTWREKVVLKTKEHFNL